MSNAYADVGAFARMQLNNAPNISASDSLEIVRLLNAVSRSIDKEARRSFYTTPRAGYFNGNGWKTLDLPDLVSVTEVAFDQTHDGTFATLLTGNGLSNTTDFFILDPDRDDPYTDPPYRMIRLHWETGAQSQFPKGFRTVRITGEWGYAKTSIPLTLASVAVTATLADATTLAMTLSASPDYPVLPGLTLLVGTEQIYVSAGSGTSFTVERAVNGTTGAAHAAVAANRVTYPDPATQACIMQTARLWARRQTPIFPHFILQGPGTGAEVLSQGLDPDVALMLRAVKNYRDLV